jgi:hypothetical protein
MDQWKPIVVSDDDGASSSGMGMDYVEETWNSLVNPNTRRWRQEENCAKAKDDNE